MKRILVIAVVLLIGVAYLGGAWPERQRRIELEAETASLRARVADAEAKGRVCELYTRVQGLIGVVTRKNYGLAAQSSTAFFDGVRTESGRTTLPAVRAALQSVLDMRDSVTTTLTNADPGSLDHLRRAADLLGGALENPPGAPASSSPVPAQQP
jgi:hypothetical protein